MALVASVTFAYNGGVITAGANLAAYPKGTKRWLAERGYSSGGLTYTAAKPFGAKALNASVTASDYRMRVFTRLIANGYVSGA